MRTRVVKGTMHISSDGDIEFHTFGGDLTFSAGGKNEWTTPQTIVGAYEPVSVEDFPLKNDKNNPDNIFCLFFRSYGQMNKGLPTKKEHKLKQNNNTIGGTEYSFTSIEKDDYKGDFGFDIRQSRLYTYCKDILNSYIVNENISTKIGNKSLNDKKFSLDKNGENSYYIPHTLIMKGKEINLYVKVFPDKHKERIKFKLTSLDSKGFPEKENNHYPFAGITISEKINQKGFITVKVNTDIEDTSIGIIAYYNNEEGKEVIAGQCNFASNKKQQINLRFLKIKISDIPTKKETTLDIIGIEHYLNNYSMNQAGIEMVVPKKNIEEIIIKKEEIEKYIEEMSLKDKELFPIFKKDKTYIIKDSFNFRKNIDEKIYTNIKNKLSKLKIDEVHLKYKSILDYQFKEDVEYFIKKLIEIYLEEFISIILLENLNNEIYLDNNNRWKFERAFESKITTPFQSEIFISEQVLEDDKGSYFVYAHEIGHSLALNHTFKENEENSIGNTLENMMDYFYPIIQDDKIIEKAPIPKCFVKQQWDIMRNHSIEREKSIEQKFKEFFNSNSTENYKDMANKMIEECQEIFKLI